MQDPHAEAVEAVRARTYEFTVERAVLGVFEKYDGWIVVGTVEAEYDVQALTRVAKDIDAASGRYRVLHKDGFVRMIAEFDVQRSATWDAERVAA